MTSPRIPVLLLGWLLCAPPVASAAPDTTVARPWLLPPQGLIEGWARTLAGERFSYHSAHPMLHASLLVRSLDSTRYAEWQTAPIPVSQTGEFAEFVWLAAMDVTDPDKTPIRFFVSLNGRRTFTLPQPRSTEPREWSIEGSGGERLSFRRLLVDKFGDVHGLMYLRVPLAGYPSGEPVTIRVQGESVDRRSWYIAYTGPVTPTLWLTSEQALIRDSGKVSQSLRLDTWSLADSVPAIVRVGGRERLRTTLPMGASVLRIPVPPVITPSRIAVEVSSGTHQAEWDGFAIEPVIRREIHLIPHSHLDIGYTDLQPEAKRRHWRAIDSALAIAARSVAYPVGARFRWNVEGLWPLETWLDSASPRQRAALTDAVRSGQFALTGLYANLLTGLSRPEELMRSAEYAEQFGRRMGVPITSAMTSDVPGYAWGLVPALARHGIRYLSSGPNYQPGLPGLGDRIGHTLTDHGDQAFWWLSPSGRDSLLVMIAGRGYSWFHGFTAGRLTIAEADRIIGYMGDLARAKYPWEIVQVRYTIGGDNGVPDAGLADVVRAWNEKFVSPKLVISTLPQLFETFERRYGATLPRLRGDFTGYWEDGAVSSAREVALNRAAAERLVQAEALAVMRPGTAPRDEDFGRAWREVLLFSEHTWGADRSITEPDAPDVQAQWVWKRQRAEDADSLSRALLNAGLPAWPDSGAGAFEVINTSSWARGGVVTLPSERTAGKLLVRDARGRAVPSQRLAGGGLAVRVGSVPAFGTARYTLDAGQAAATAAAGAAGDSLWNEQLVVRVDTVTGAVRSARWQGRELVNSTEGGWSDYRYVPGRSAANAAGVHGVRLAVVDSGPLVATLRIESAAPGARSLVRELRLVAGGDALEITTTLDKLGIREKEGVHLAFPFLVPGGQVRMDMAWAVVRPDADQLRGANRNVYPVQRWVDVSNAEFGVTLATVDAPLIEIGRMTAEEWHHEDGTEDWLRSAPRSQTIFSYLMNNYWHTNYKADQPGRATFRYSVRPHLHLDLAAAARFGAESSQPLLLAAPGPPIRSGLPVPAEGTLVTSLRPLPDGHGYEARLFNPTADARAGLGPFAMRTIRRPD